MWIPVGALVAVFVASLAAGCGGPEVLGPPTSNYVPWGAKGGPTPELQAPDHDGDGVLNDADRCPDLPEDLDGFRDGDGCPDPDDDGDGIPDAKDPDWAGPTTEGTEKRRFEPQRAKRSEGFEPQRAQRAQRSSDW